MTVYPGMRYVTLLDMTEQELTKYSKRHLHLLIKKEDIPFYVLAGKVALDALGVERVMAWEHARSEEGPRPGKRPGQKNRAARKPRKAQRSAVQAAPDDPGEPTMAEHSDGLAARSINKAEQPQVLYTKPKRRAD